MSKPAARVVKLRDLLPDDKNANKGTERGLRLLDDSLREDGAGRGILIDRNNRIVAGNKTVERAIDDGFEEIIIVPTDGRQLVATQRVDVDLDSPQGRRMALRDNRVSEVDLAWDADVLKELGADVNLSDLWREDELAELLEQADDLSREDSAEDADTPDDLLFHRYDVPDAVWASDNEYGIPLLDMKMQANAFDTPILAWVGQGVSQKQQRHKGFTVHFYVDDFQFNALWSSPYKLLNVGCVTAVEPNFSIYDETPRAVALYQIYRKRWLARWWQQMGIRCVVDLNISRQHYDIALLGVPQGWAWYATRGYTERMDSTIAEYEMAVKHADGNTVNFMVYGGGKQVKALCQERGWLWLPEARDQGKDKVKHGEG